MNSEGWTKRDGYLSEWGGPEGFIKTEHDATLFHIGQCYDDEAAKKISCNLCGCDKLYVGQGSYYTAVKCPECEWELPIHDG